MTSPRRLTAVLAALAALTLLALGAAGCGVKQTDSAANADLAPPSTLDVDPPSTEDQTPETTEGSSSDDERPTTTEGSSDDDPSETTIPDLSDIPGFDKDQLAKIYTDIGLSQEQAECLVDEILGQSSDPNFDPQDMSAVFDFLEKCDISITDFGGGGFSPGN